MVRPSAEVINEITVGDQRWQILAANSYYLITYMNKPIGIRVVGYGLNGPEFKYRKLTYTNLGNAQAQARLLNHRFKCLDFAVIEVDFDTLD